MDFHSTAGGKRCETAAMLLTKLTSIQQRATPCLRIVGKLKPEKTQNPMKEYHWLQSKIAKPFDVCWNNFMPTSDFPFYAVFSILIASSGTFQLICIMYSVIIQMPLLRKKHVMCPQKNKFTSYCVSVHHRERIIVNFYF